MAGLKTHFSPVSPFWAWWVSTQNEGRDERKMRLDLKPVISAVSVEYIKIVEKDLNYFSYRSSSCEKYRIFTKANDISDPFH